MYARSGEMDGAPLGSSRISNQAGRCQEGFSFCLTLLESLFFSFRHTHALAQERPVSRPAVPRRSLIRVHPTRSARVTSSLGVAHQASLRS